MLTVLCIVAIGTAGWAIAWQSGVWSPQAPEVPGKGDLGSGGEGGGGKKEIAVGASVLGYFSAVCYLGYVPHLA